jgi:hypothetical protein
MEKWLEISAAVLAFVAAVFWFLSASGTLPQMLFYWGHAPANDAFYQAMKFSAKMNTWAAVFSGASALCLGFAGVKRWRSEFRKTGLDRGGFSSHGSK